MGLGHVRSSNISESGADYVCSFLFCGVKETLINLLIVVIGHLLKLHFSTMHENFDTTSRHIFRFREIKQNL